MDGTCHVCHSDLARVGQNVNRWAGVARAEFSTAHRIVIA